MEALGLLDNIAPKNQTVIGTSVQVVHHTKFAKKKIERETMRKMLILEPIYFDENFRRYIDGKRAMAESSASLELLALVKLAHEDESFQSPSRDYSRFCPISGKSKSDRYVVGDLDHGQKVALLKEWGEKYENNELGIRIDPYYAAVYSRIGNTNCKIFVEKS